MISFILEPNPALSPFILGLSALTLGLGVFVLVRGKNNVSTAFFYFCLSLAIWGVSHAIASLGASPGLTVAAAYGTVLGALPIPLAFLLLSSCFPHGIVPFRPWQLAALSLPSVILFFSAFTGQLISTRVLPDNRLFVALGPFNYLYMLNVLFGFTAGAAIIIYRYRNADAYEKIKIRYFFAGLLLTALIGYSLSEFLLIFGIHKYVYLGPAGTSFLVFLTTYAILKHRLMDITLAIKKTTSYSLITTAITAVYVLVVLAFEFIFRSVFGYFSFLAAVPASLIIAVTFIPLRQRLQNITDQLFFRRIIEYQNIVKEVTRLIVSVTDLPTLFRLIDRTIIRAMCVRGAALLLFEEKENLFRVEKANGLPDEVANVKLTLNSPLPAYLAEKREALVRDELKSLLLNQRLAKDERERLTAVYGEMKKLQAAVALPSFTRDKMVGFLCLGDKLSDESYSPDDLELLATLAGEAAIAIENAKLYKDITETRDYLDNLIRESNDAIVTLDLDGKITSWNDGARRIFGYEAAEQIGRRPRSVPEKEILDSIALILKGETINSYQTKAKNKAEVEIPLILSASPVRDAAGEITGIFVIMKDITEIKKVDRLKTELLSVVSHELRTPLTPIKGYLELLASGKMGALEPRQKEALAQITRQSNHLHALIETLIDISRTEAGRPVELQKEPLFLDGVVRESASLSEPFYAEKGVKLEGAYPAEPVALMGDRFKLLRVMDSLLGNALKFTPPGGEVNIILEKLDGTAQVAVADTGIGLAPENLGKIFDRFFQVDSHFNRSSGGIGMGLTVAREIVRAHGGKIRAESEGAGKGSKLIFTLPLS